MDWLCNNEVALYHHAYMLNSIVKRSPESNYQSTTVSLTTQIMETCEEEVMMYMASPKFLRPLDNSPDMSTTRLNNLTRVFVCMCVFVCVCVISSTFEIIMNVAIVFF